MLKLGVNVDHAATLREARYRGRPAGEPDPVEVALLCEKAGAHGITVHLREDRRHIQDHDARRMRDAIKTRLNFELANTPEIVGIALDTRPDIVCVVPEKREEVTTEGGLDVHSQVEPLRNLAKRFNDAGIDVSLFVDPDLNQIEASSRVGAQFVELHTGAFAEAVRGEGSVESELARLEASASKARELGIQVNAGHGLNYKNLPLLNRIPHLVELNIGHSILSRSVIVGVQQAVQEMLELMRTYPG